MIGFGSIGKGTLPLIERHFEFDKSRFVVIDPDDSDRASARRARHRIPASGDHRENYREVLTKYLTAGGGQGFCVNLSVDTSSLAIMEHCREIGALYIDTVVEPWPGFYFDKSLGPETRAPTTRCARRCSPSAQAQVRRTDRRLLLRRQSRHGLVVRQTGAAQSRRRPRRQGRRAEERARNGAGSPIASA